MTDSAELQAAVERASHALVNGGNKWAASVLVSDLRLILADLEARGEALEPFAKVLKGNYSHQPDSLVLTVGFGPFDSRLKMKLGDFRRALTALGGSVNG